MFQPLGFLDLGQEEAVTGVATTHSDYPTPLCTTQAMTRAKLESSTAILRTASPVLRQPPCFHSAWST